MAGSMLLAEVTYLVTSSTHFAALSSLNADEQHDAGRAPAARRLAVSGLAVVGSIRGDAWTPHLTLGIAGALLDPGQCAAPDVRGAGSR